MHKIWDFCGYRGYAVYLHDQVILLIEKLFVVATNNAIYKSQTFENGSMVFSPLPLSNVGSPYGIDVDIDAGLIFWTDSLAGTIKKASLDGGDVTSLTTSRSTGRKYILSISIISKSRVGLLSTANTLSRKAVP